MHLECAAGLLDDVDRLQVLTALQSQHSIHRQLSKVVLVLHVTTDTHSDDRYHEQPELRTTRTRYDFEFSSEIVRHKGARKLQHRIHRQLSRVIPGLHGIADRPPD